MPPVNQGSRGGLITAVVIFAILFVVATICAIVFSVKWSNAELMAEQDKKRYGNVVAEAALASPEVQELTTARDQEGAPVFALNNTMKALDVALAQRNGLARTITGSASSPVEAKTAADTALAGAAAKLQPAGVQVPADSLAGAVNTLAAAVEAREQQIKDLNNQLAAERAKVQQQATEFQQALAARDAAVEEVRAEAQNAITEASTDREGKQGQLDEIEQARADERAQAQEAVNAIQVQLQTRERELAQLKSELAAARERAGANRVDVREPVMRQTDGEIVRVPGGGIVYINLGQGDQVTPGLTFQVYDRTEGVPSVEADEEELNTLPVGKGSIEVISVGPSSSEARIIKQTPGTAISEGDVIANLVFDPNTKYNFNVYGDFDMDGNGVATAGDAEIVRRLVTQWGGNLTDRVGVDTDFVVLGKEPVLPNFTQEELLDAFNQKKLSDAQAALDAYLDVVSKAQDLHIPILNQNRFLYLIGYFDQARR